VSLIELFGLPGLIIGLIVGARLGFHYGIVGAVPESLVGAPPGWVLGAAMTFPLLGLFHLLDRIGKLFKRL
jgi:hypothetical protein